MGLCIFQQRYHEFRCAGKEQLRRNLEMELVDQESRSISGDGKSPSRRDAEIHGPARLFHRKLCC